MGSAVERAPFERCSPKMVNFPFENKVELEKPPPFRIEYFMVEGCQ
jgi:hypothetical protein